ncbi:tRNA (adenosine(37)-N6)-threonylcarbamoyltransferase complex dimerization subunit type 1 TsaB [Hylemonella gracilis]|uniref:Peptidase M22, glycoprotease n=1 Tax=Hylemonella gracilis ATCC 19624 TaxID=887062 RepID=F3KXV9_9BURK|nr:tRNA (adenosine(37)-N6)-threonylcarbamoyltransferase complex dimerization subunit type 1 TsaB [Hylemonella gracilis]EGI75384.1 peptidase M22, glycoprotease [Hylemonella gracilis ATCC 19624]
MKLLALDTTTDQLSVALTRDGQVWQHQGAGAAQASVALIPAIDNLMAQAGLRYAELDAIAFGSGPGAFTGLRTACAVAQGLAYGASVPVLPVDSLLTLVEEARARHAPQAQTLRVLALLDARMDELYAAPYRYADGQWQRQAPFALHAPEALPAWQGDALAGNVFAAYGERLAWPASVPRWSALPLATAMLRLAPALLAQGGAVRAEDALPQYVRDKVAKTTEERLRERMAQQSSTR